MKNKAGILTLCLVASLFGSAAMAIENTASISDVSGQKVASLGTEELVKEVIKQTIYTVGNTVLQKYANPNGASSTFIPSYIPSTSPTTPTTTAPSTTTTGTSTVTPSEQGDVIIIH